MISKPKIIGAVEIGTAKITVLVGEVSQGRSLTIIGWGEFPSCGVVKGMVTDYKQASEATHRALIDAERSAGVKIDEVFLAQTGGHLEGFYNEASVNVAAANYMVSSEDISMVSNLAKSRQLPAGRVVIHHIRRPYRLDGRMVPDPENLVGRRLEAGYWIVHGLESKIADEMHVVRGFKIHVSDLIISGLASGSLLTTPEDRQAGALVIDIGAGTTDYVLYRDGCPIVAGAIPLGGSHFTNDLSLGLRLTQTQAEKIKLRYGRANVTAKDRSEKVWLNGDFTIGDRNFPLQTVQQITSARAAELFEVVKQKLGQAFAAENCHAGIILTGGASQMPGMEVIAANIFGVQARAGELPGWVTEKLRSPEYSTTLGLLSYGLAAQNEANSNRRRGVKGLLRELFTT